MAGNVGKDIQDSLRSVKRTILGIFKIVVKLIKTLLKFGFWGIIGIAILLVLVILIIVMYSFLGSDIDDDIISSSTSASRNYDTNDVVNNVIYSDKKNVQKQMDSIVKGTIENEDFNEAEIEELNKEIGRLSSKKQKYSNELKGAYDENAGYQMLNHEITIMLMLERLTYAYTFTDWEPDYLSIKNVDEKIDELNKAKATSNSAGEILEIEEDLKILESAQETLYGKYERYLELNRAYKEKYKSHFINSSIKSKISPDGVPLESKVISYIKDAYGVDTEETKEELSYFHNIIIRSFEYEKEFSEMSDCTELEEWLENPEYDDEDYVKETDSWYSLTSIEEPYKVNFELMHHEATLKLIQKDIITNTVLKNPIALAQVKDALASHMPIFQYVTYDPKVIQKTFYTYEIYEDNAFDAATGKYIYSPSFDTKLAKYISSSNYDIDFSKVESRAEKEYLLSQYEMQLENQKKLTKKDTILINDLETEIRALKDELEDGKSSDTLLEEYNSNYNAVLDAMISQDESTRIYDPKNHSIVVDNDGSYYLSYGERKLDNYNETVTVDECMTYFHIEEDGYIYYSPKEWEEITESENFVDEDVEDEDKYDCEREVDAKVETRMIQSSLKPLAIRTIFTSVDYVYSKTGNRETNVEEKIEKAREDGKWERQEIIRKKIEVDEEGNELVDEEGELILGPAEKVYNYKRNTELTFSNSESIVGTTIESPNNENILYEHRNQTMGFYDGNQTSISSDYVQTPGTLGTTNDKDNQDIKYGKNNNIKIYYQNDYTGVYGDKTISTEGCGPVCLAMVVDSLTNKNVGVIEMCNWAYENGYKCPEGGSYWNLIPEGAEHYGLKVTGLQITDKDGVMKALGDEKVIIMICDPGVFSEENQHFIVLTGIDKNQNVSINDPANKDNTNKKWSIDQIMQSASIAQGELAVTFWVIE